MIIEVDKKERMALELNGLEPLKRTLSAEIRQRDIHTG